jgi:hypothetical protein
MVSRVRRVELSIWIETTGIGTSPSSRIVKTQLNLIAITGSLQNWSGTATSPACNWLNMTVQPILVQGPEGIDGNIMADQLAEVGFELPRKKSSAE